MKLQYYHYILFFVLLYVLFELREKFFGSTSPGTLIQLQTSRPFIGLRNSFVALGYPDWGDK